MITWIRAGAPLPRRGVPALLLLLAACQIGSAADEPPARPSVAVARFDPKGLPDGVNPNTLTDLLLEFGKCGLRHQAVLPSDDLDKVIERINKERVATGKLKVAIFPKAAARFLLLPSASRLDGEWMMTAPLIDLQSGEFRVIKATRKGDAAQFKEMVEDLWRELDAPTLLATLPHGTVFLELEVGLKKDKVPVPSPGIQVAFSRDGKLLATGVVPGSWDTTARLWDVATGKERALLRHDGNVRSVAFSPDGKLLATGSSDNNVRLWSVAP